MKKTNKPSQAISKAHKSLLETQKTTGKPIDAETAEKFAIQALSTENKKFESLDEINTFINEQFDPLAAARSYGNKLTSKMVHMTLNKSSIDKMFYDNLINTFTVDGVQVGTGYEYVAQIIGGVENYDVNKFVPNALIETNSQIQLCSFNPNIKKFPTHLTEIELLELFTNPVILGEFLAKLRDFVNDAVSMYLFNEILKTLTGYANIRTITGTAASTMESWIELSQKINSMSAYTYDYSIKGNIANDDRLPKATPKTDIIIIMNADTQTVMKQGVSSGLFHNTIWESTECSVIGIAGNQITLGAPGAKPVESTTPLIGKNDVYVLERDALRLFFGFKETSNQVYGENMVNVFNVFLKYGIDIISFLKGFKYSNPKLNNYNGII